jgi:hypothetical protein
MKTLAASFIEEGAGAELGGVVQEGAEAVRDRCPFTPIPTNPGQACEAERTIV